MATDKFIGQKEGSTKASGSTVFKLEKENCTFLKKVFELEKKNYTPLNLSS
jgi:hypothetical protein